MEVFNACEPPSANEAAAELAQRHRLPGFGGSDSHKHDCVGSAYTEFPDDILTESDLIRYIRKKKPVSCGGAYYHGTTRERIGSLNNILVYSFWVYNKAAGLRRYPKRRLAFKDYKKESGKAQCSA